MECNLDLDLTSRSPTWNLCLFASFLRGVRFSLCSYAKCTGASWDSSPMQMRDARFNELCVHSLCRPWPAKLCGKYTSRRRKLRYVGAPIQVQGRALRALRGLEFQSEKQSLRPSASAARFCPNESWCVCASTWSYLIIGLLSWNGQGMPLSFFIFQRCAPP